MAALTALTPLLENDVVQEKFIKSNSFALLVTMVNTKNSRLKVMHWFWFRLRTHWAQLHVLEALVNFVNDPDAEEQLEPLKLKER